MRYPSPTEVVYLEARSRCGASFLNWLNDRTKENETAFLDTLAVLEMVARVARRPRVAERLPVPEAVTDIPLPALVT